MSFLSGIKQIEFADCGLVARELLSLNWLGTIRVADVGMQRVVSCCRIVKVNTTLHLARTPRHSKFEPQSLDFTVADLT